ncbi:N-6 DNA methylase [Bradyrhizobium manausense]|uniref:Eco57I restriction-modification methylase domain-containing protein n=1 Tax=Bradyrhizobium manausense TaxID=989370 RepID=UPI001BAB0553|nr:DNA methyltransferase [Bradyrhizobium manausense]MBR0689898.1 N-6 DNA methylase [Bradyrhizobium manausense]
MAREIKRDPDLEWLDHVRPVGLVVAPVLLKELGLPPLRQTQLDSAVVAAHIGDDDRKPAMADPWGFVRDVLGWEAAHVAGSPDGPPVPGDLHVGLPEHATTLSPTWAVKELAGSRQRWQLLVRIEQMGIDPDARTMHGGWEATAHQRFERLLRETGVYAGVLISERSEHKDGEDRLCPELRLVYAPRGETSGYVTFPLRDLRTVAGRPMLGGLKLLLDSTRLFTDASDRRLPALLAKSREAQAAVSTTLAEQVLGALHELLRGMDTVAPDLVRELARERPEHLYEGLLTVLMRLVFVLYAEDRDLLPSRTDGRARELYETGYSLRGLYDRLTHDAALNPDTMDERRGAWGQLLALFRLIHVGHPSHFVQARGGKLFDPDQFAFLEGRKGAGGASRVLPVSDGCVLRILEGLMTLAAKGGTRERLSYRTLDVEQIGSVYETVMGFRAELAEGKSLAIRAGKNNHTPVFVDLDALAKLKGKERVKYLREEADRGQLSGTVSKAVEAAKGPAELAAALDGIVDERGSPKKHPVAAGTPILQPTDERRRTGSHYTPRTLTAPIVERALAPSFNRLGSDATPEQILELKVCDPAMGSGAFLVEACRALATRLAKAWERHPDKKPKNIPPDEDDDLHAKRLVAQRCLYGVDKNPLATDLARLSLWLVTLARDHEFTFLDHALKSGDSLVGLTRVQIAAAHWDTSKSGLPLFRTLVKDRVDEVMKGRAEIQAAPDDTARAIQEQRHRSLELRLKEIRLIGDAVIAAFFAEDKPKTRERKRADVEGWLGGTAVAWDKIAAMAATAKTGEHPFTPFHWEIEFPEVFAADRGGFDAIVGNPPFLGGTNISGSLGDRYLSYLKENAESAGNRADLVSYFFQRAFALLTARGAAGLVATNTVSQGDTREAATAFVLKHGGTIYGAVKRFAWPGEAAVIVSIVHFSKREVGIPPSIDGRAVKHINSFLLNSIHDGSPNRLGMNLDKTYKGLDIYGSGFLFDDSDKSGASNALTLIDQIQSKRPTSKTRIFPYIGGQEVNSDPRHAPHRYVFDINDLNEVEARKHFPELMQIAEQKIKPERMKLRDNVDGKRLKLNWWRYNRTRNELFSKTARMRKVIAACRVSPHFSIALLPANLKFADSLIVFVFETFAAFAAIQSRAHELWARFFASSLKDDLRYTPSDCFETFPFPINFIAAPKLEAAGRLYHDCRATLMVARNEGMTKTYNRFHNPAETAEDVRRLRELHAAMDRAVLESYGWHDLATRAAPVFLDETNEDNHSYQGRLFWPSDFRDEVLARLLALNAERHAEEVRLGVAPSMKGQAEADDEEGGSDND